MTKKQSSTGFSAIEVLVAILVIVVLAASAWFIWHKHTTTSAKKTNAVAQSNTGHPAQPNDPSERGKYLVIKEWGVRVALPNEFQGKTTYVLGDTSVDEDNNQLQNAKIFVGISTMGESTLDENVCAVVHNAAIGDVIDTGAQYIRSESSKPFDATRYKFTFKENVLSSNPYNYHLNYLTPDCVAAAGANNIAKIEGLQSALLHLVKVN